MLRSKIAVALLSAALATMGFVPLSMAAGAESAQSPKAPKPAAAKASKAKKERVVLQVSDGDPKTWNQALNVAKNLQQAYGKDKLDIEVVAFGNGIGMLKMDSEVGDRVGEAIESGAKVYACQNTMRGRKLSKEDMLATVSYVPAGIVEIIDKQREGWAVVRP